MLNTSQRGFFASAGSYFFDSARERLHLGRGIDRLVEGRHVHQVQQQVRALQVAQELVPEARAFGRALDQAGDVGDHERAVHVHAHHAQVRMQRRERIVGDLGARRRTPRE